MRFPVRGVVALWSGNEDVLFLGNPVIEYRGQDRLTRGEQWKTNGGLAETPVDEIDGIVQVRGPETGLREGDVAWIAGHRFAMAYRTLLATSQIQDVLNLESWQSTPDGCRVRFDSAAHFYEAGAALADFSQSIYEPQLSLVPDPLKNRTILAARSVYEGCPGVPQGQRRLADAYWFYGIQDARMFERAVRRASRLIGSSEAEIKQSVDERFRFYTRLETDRQRRELADIVRVRERLTRDGIGAGAINDLYTDHLSSGRIWVGPAAANLILKATRGTGSINPSASLAEWRTQVPELIAAKVDTSAYTSRAVGSLSQMHPDFESSGPTR